MKKEQKIIELRRAAKLKVAEIETKIAIARSDAACIRARIMWERAAELDGLKADSTERLDVLAVYRAKLADANKQLESEILQLKLKIQQTKAECEKQCAAAEVDTETITDKDDESDVKVKGFQPQQETVYCDGSEHSARIVARRMINKMPYIPKEDYIFIHIIRDDDGDFFVSISVRGKSPDDNIVKIFSKKTHTAESEAEFIEEARAMLTTDEKKDISNSHVAEPLSSALDAFFGGNPVEQVENLVSDTVKDGKEADNE